MPDSDKKAAALKQVHARPSGREPNFLKANYEANESLRALLLASKCMPCAESGIDAQAFFLMPAKDHEGGVGLFGLCFAHLGHLLNSSGDRRSLMGVSIGRAAVPIIGFGDDPSRNGPESLRHLKCGVCLVDPGISRQSDIFCAVTQKSEPFTDRPGEQAFLVGFCLSHARKVLA